MSTVAERTRAAMDAVTARWTARRRCRCPRRSPGRLRGPAPLARVAPRRRWGAWLAPLAAAAA